MIPQNDCASVGTNVNFEPPVPSCASHSQHSLSNRLYTLCSIELDERGAVLTAARPFSMYFFGVVRHSPSWATTRTMATTAPDTPPRRPLPCPVRQVRPPRRACWRLLRLWRRGRVAVCRHRRSRRHCCPASERQTVPVPPKTGPLSPRHRVPMCMRRSWQSSSSSSCRRCSKTTSSRPASLRSQTLLQLPPQQARQKRRLRLKSPQKCRFPMSVSREGSNSKRRSIIVIVL